MNRQNRLKSLFIGCLVILGSISTAFSQERYRLSSTMDVKVSYRGVLEHVMQLPVGTIVELDSYDYLGRTRYETGDGRIMTSQRGWLRVVDIELNRAPRYGSELEYGIERFYRRQSREAFYISEAIDQLASRMRPVYSTPAPVQRPAPVYQQQPVYNNFNAYEVCYTQPRTHWVTMKQDQARAGQTNTILGAGLAIGGLLLGGSNDQNMRNIGTVMTIGGAALATVGLVQMADARSAVTVYDTRCDQYYTRDTQVRTVYIQNQRCTTERYYSRSWDREVEYFQTTCSSQRYYSFERNSQIW